MFYSGVTLNFPRNLNLSNWLKHKSLFLLGPRQSGKSTLLKLNFPKATYIDLLASDTFRELSRYPESLSQTIQSGAKQVIIDEVQTLPTLLNEVQRLIDTRPELRFILTGSSARKLRRGQVNLLGGRALEFHLHPLNYAETGEDYLLPRLTKGSLPAILNSEIYWTELKSYVGLYLKEEIQAESAVRKLEQFARFFDMCAWLNGKQLNYTKVGNDSGVSPRTVKDYVQVLIDTLIVSTLPPYRKTASRKTVATEKIYFFDIGVSNFLIGRKEVYPKTPAFGENLEHLIFLELRAYLDYLQRDEMLTYWRTTSQIEVDFIVGDHTAIEVKGAGRVSTQDLKSLKILSEEMVLKTKIVVCDEKEPRTVDGIKIYPIILFLQKLWAGEIF